MPAIRFSVTINASREKIWEMLWNPDAYRLWTSAFTEGSYAVTDDWKEGSKVLFLGPDRSGMVSRVAAHQPNAFMSFEHLGIVKEGVEDTSSEQVKAWAGAKENYTLTGDNGTSTILIEMDIPDDFKDYMEKAWPIALEKVKALSEGTAKTMIIIETDVQAGAEKVWEYWTNPAHIMQWNQAADSWHCPAAVNDLRTGGSFSYTMAAKDGSFSFDFGGVYSKIIHHKKISYTMGDGRKATVLFEEKNGTTHVTESFEAEETNPLTMQRSGWQSILDNFRKHTEHSN